MGETAPLLLLLILNVGVYSEPIVQGKIKHDPNIGSNWIVTPSSSFKIGSTAENPKILQESSASVPAYNYYTSQSIATKTKNKGQINSFEPADSDLKPSKFYYEIHPNHESTYYSQPVQPQYTPYPYKTDTYSNYQTITNYPQDYSNTYNQHQPISKMRS